MIRVCTHDERRRGCCDYAIFKSGLVRSGIVNNDAVNVGVLGSSLRRIIEKEYVLEYKLRRTAHGITSLDTKNYRQVNVDRIC